MKKKSLIGGKLKCKKAKTDKYCSATERGSVQIYPSSSTYKENHS